MRKKAYLFSSLIFLAISLFAFLANFKSTAFAQFAGCKPIGVVQQRVQGLGVCQQKIYGPPGDCSRSGSDTGTFCCTTVDVNGSFNNSCAAQDISGGSGVQYQVYCCNVPPTPIPPSPTPIPPTPTSSVCSCGQWQTSGGCGQENCESGSIPQYRSCTSSCPNITENRCLVSSSCTPTPTIAPTATTAPTVAPTSTPIPTPTSIPKHSIIGAVYYDKNSNNVIDGNDTLYSGAGISIQDTDNPSVTGSYTTDASGVYQTSKLWQTGHFISVKLNNVPQDCFVYESRNPNNFFMPNANANVSFPIICGQPTPTSGPTPTTRPTPTRSPTPTVTPTPDPKAKITIQGKHVNKNGIYLNDKSVNLQINQGVTISPCPSSPCEDNGQGTWEFRNRSAGTYIITANAPPSAYAIYYSYYTQNKNGEILIQSKPYIPGRTTVPIPLNGNGDSANVTFRYTSSSEDCAVDTDCVNPPICKAVEQSTGFGTCSANGICTYPDFDTGCTGSNGQPGTCTFGQCANIAPPVVQGPNTLCNGNPVPANTLIPTVVGGIISTIDGKVYADTNYDGFFNEGDQPLLSRENGLGGVQVNLYQSSELCKYNFHQICSGPGNTGDCSASYWSWDCPSYPSSTSTNWSFVKSQTTDINGCYTFRPEYPNPIALPNNTYSPYFKVEIPTNPLGYLRLGPNILGPRDLAKEPQPLLKQNLGIVPIYSISGSVFINTNTTDVKDFGDINYITGPIDLTSNKSGLSTGAINTSVCDKKREVCQVVDEFGGENCYEVCESSHIETTYSGNYSLSAYPPGRVNLTFNAPSGYELVYPDPGSTTATVSVTAGPGACSSLNQDLEDHGVECDPTSFAISKLNFGIRKVIRPAWFQAIGGDIRRDDNFTFDVPPLRFISIPNRVDGMPGIVFTGELAPPPQEVSEGFDWKVGGSGINREVFTDTHNLIPTSYKFLLETAQGSGITPTTITTLDSSLTHGIYKTDQDLTINTPVTFGLGNFIILVNGNLNINKEIIVPVGSTVIFSASQDIKVDKSIGESDPSSTEFNIEGLYSADRHFIAEGKENNCISPDLRLNVAGTVVANAGRGTGIEKGTFNNRRDLCDQNLKYPSVSFIERPDFMLNFPGFVTQTTRSWQDVAP